MGGRRAYDSEGMEGFAMMRTSVEIEEGGGTEGVQCRKRWLVSCAVAAAVWGPKAFSSPSLAAGFSLSRSTSTPLSALSPSSSTNTTTTTTSVSLILLVIGEHGWF
ncbi:hypothetical protein MRB53_015621 [Persea americana]|uniref:Uncharacterized protein n=1 Tax=Persea americana TaxID=3435 RepID=A0ACC2M135_PERAE|nr:hypothetical protein MRB53_015621 [Persea americana]